MHLDVSFLPLLAKMAATATFVVVATRIAEKSGPLVGAMVATLPLAAAPAYVFLALDHDSRFIAATAVASLAANAANVVFCTIHAVAAQRFRSALSLTVALSTWLLVAFGIHFITWTALSAALLNLAIFALCFPIAARHRQAAMPALQQHWYDVPLRAAMVAVLVATVVTVSSRVGPSITGIFALFPIVLISMVIIFQPRIGGQATAALTANAIMGLVGYGTALVALHVAAIPLGSPTALALALSVSIGWNLSVALVRRRKSLVRPLPARLGDPSSQV